jgi:hypothetical protein
MDKFVKDLVPKFKPVSDEIKEKRKQYYEANKDIIKERARAHSKKQYSNEDYKEAVRIKNANYRLMLKEAKELLMKHYNAKLPLDSNNQ